MPMPRKVTDIKSMDDVGMYVMHAIDHQMQQAIDESWECTFAKMDSRIEQVAAPPGARPMYAVFASADGKRRLVIASWYPPIGGEEFVFCTAPSSETVQPVANTVNIQNVESPVPMETP